MVFCSVEFLLYFLPAFLIIYGITPESFRNITLLAGSLVFYACGDPKYLTVLLISVLINYLVAGFLGADEEYRENWKKKRSWIDFEEWRKGVLAFALTGNVGLLLLFKVTLRDGALPLGVSFYTFQIISYLVDVYRREIRYDRSLIRTAVFITMFPKLVAGPIVKYSEVSEELPRRHMTMYTLQSGLKIFALGLASKVLLADRIGLLWNDVQVRGFESITTPLAWLGAIAFSFKLYFDFYGYSLMAMGLGVMVGFALPDNFRHPYMARSVREFYRRWHITLGRWFRDYVYIPLGGNREGELCTIRNLLIVWALTGLWHGGRGNFIIWGLFLWILIVMERGIGGFLDKHPIGGVSICKQMVFLPHLYLWLIIPMTWMCFAIPDVQQMGIYLGRMLGQLPQFPALAGDWRKALEAYGPLLIVCCIASTPVIRNIYRKWKDSFLVNVITAALFWVCVWRIMEEGNNPFLYFKF